MRPRFDYGAMRAALVRWRGDGPARRIRVARADTLRRRALGLIGREVDALPEDGGILFERCTCVHTVGMRRPIALVWLGREVDGAMEIVSVDAAVPPMRVMTAPRGAASVLEMRAWDPSIEADPPARLEIHG